MSQHFDHRRFQAADYDDQLFDDLDDDTMQMDPMNDATKQVVHQDFFNSFQDDIDEDDLFSPDQ
ncbi:hypothetical protein SAMD00019534_080240 [Acytostelium subglobosum LB1]|uniref:hypothetical protein n=1 Tax=Acytostelium subglobosum LB1 TaxID=1410327 RepID=UPI00064496D0|nr:hypothetical protein SAMD00019534_080240 [Acytostelium subglobosum LB1]GAM24849.1 hypothetical protein SAMD00019534_080240 [Acytostelium subglobosum LB1]|eukprot:XP_012751938.1 hypothetical protein SAMD00019534_080240 [Acytostelium subglobosum LB1]